MSDPADPVVEAPTNDPAEPIEARAKASAKLAAVIATLEGARYSLALGRVELGRVDPGLGIAAAITELSALAAARAVPATTEPRVIVTVSIDGNPVFIGSPRKESNDMMRIDHETSGPAWLTCHLPGLSVGAVPSEPELQANTKPGLDLKFVPSEPGDQPVTEWERPHPFVRVDGQVTCGVCGEKRNQNFGQHVERER